MKTNMGTADRMIRLLAAVVIVGVIINGALSGPATWVLGILAAVLLLTGSIKFCPIYRALNLSSARKTEPLSH